MKTKKKAAPKPEKKGAGHVFYLLDETGSMTIRKNDAIGGFNTYVESMKKSGCKFTLVLFNTTKVETRHKAVPISEVKPLDVVTYKPTACTPLYDAIGKTIKDADDTGDEHVIFVITSDGEENSSREYTKEGVKALIEERTKKGWVFEYMGVLFDNFLSAGHLGISRATVYSNSSFPVGDAARARASSHADYTVSGNYKRWDKKK